MPPHLSFITCELVAIPALSATKTTAATLAPSTTAAAKAAVFLGTRFVDVQRPAIQLPAV